jgi:hypothetical protein
MFGKADRPTIVGVEAVVPRVVETVRNQDRDPEPVSGEQGQVGAKKVVDSILHELPASGGQLDIPGSNLKRDHHTLRT